MRGARANGNRFARDVPALPCSGHVVLSARSVRQHLPHATGPASVPHSASVVRMLRRLAIASASTALLAAAPLRAQVIIDDPEESGPSASAGAAYLALSLTPVGALAPSADYLLARPGAAPRPLRFHGRFGSIDHGDGIGQRTFAAMVDMPLAATALSITAGYVDATCDDLEDDSGGDASVDCKGGITLGARLGSSFFSRSLDAAGTSALVRSE